jgi:hypothetical protein
MPADWCHHDARNYKSQIRRNRALAGSLPAGQYGFLVQFPVAQTERVAVGRRHEWLFNRCNLCQLSFVLRQHTAEGHAN